LRSGVILCRIIQKIKPELMPRISARPLPFLQMENIHNFLNAAKELGVKPDNLFQTADLYEGTDMNKLINIIKSIIYWNIINKKQNFHSVLILNKKKNFFLRLFIR